ncbi:hypothetical protein IF188_05295 [Microbacterium sp. NEAU-LLC]|uniref:Uncharacterized protein n=1 Tax=Microbacterium helvum TaxID=2773713 RepID=A0ABR8NLS7_9MICO|nr:hypothetical protein [Microbacterium helvum]MBD3941114.1 hypothetical protein [Microbacterium helvum]
MNSRLSPPARLRRALFALVFTLAVLTTAVAVTVAYRAAAADAPAGAPAIAGAVDETSDGAVTEADGILPAGAGPFDDRYPGIARLSPALLDALRRAAKDASADNSRRASRPACGGHRYAGARSLSPR